MTELNDGANLGRARQFCFDDFVRPIAEIAPLVDSTEEVRTSIPITIFEDRLINYIDTRTQRLDRRRDGIGARHLSWYRGYSKPLIQQTFEVGLLMLQAKLY